MNLLTKTPLVSYSAPEIRQIADLRSVFSHTIFMSQDLSFSWRPERSMIETALRVHVQILGKDVWVDVSQAFLNEMLAPYALRAQDMSLDSLKLMALTRLTNEHVVVTDLSWVADVPGQLQAYEDMNQEALPWYVGFSHTEPAILRALQTALIPLLSETTLPTLTQLPITLPLSATQIDWPVTETIQVGDVILLEGA